MQGDIFAIKKRKSIIIYLLLILIALGSIYITEYDVIKGFTSIIKAIQWASGNFYPDVKSLEKLSGNN